MKARLEWLNQLRAVEAQEALFACCGVRLWAAAMVAERPFTSEQEFFAKAREIWDRIPDDARREVFKHHPRIGDVKALRERFAGAGNFAGGEQSSVRAASEETLRLLARGNADYEDKFGYIFLVRATGRSADEMLTILKKRLANDPATELRIAFGEQAEIMKIRLEKLLLS